MLDSSNAIAYLCNQGGMASLFLLRLACHILNLINKHDIALMPSNIYIHLGVEATISLWVGWFPNGTYFLTELRLGSSLGSTGGGSDGALVCQSVSVLHLRKFPTSWCLEAECFKPPWMYQVRCVSSSSFSTLVLSKFLAEHVTGQFRFLILMALCWMEASWFPTVLNMLEMFITRVLS